MSSACIAFTEIMCPVLGIFHKVITFYQMYICSHWRFTSIMICHMVKYLVQLMLIKMHTTCSNSNAFPMFAQYISFDHCPGKSCMS
jgi:hypothetical protein